MGFRALYTGLIGDYGDRLPVDVDTRIVARGVAQACP